MDRTRKLVITICVLLGLVVLTAMDAMFGGLRFTNGRANATADFAACWLPLVCVVLIGFLPRTKARFWGVVGLAPLAALCGLGGTAEAIGESLLPATVLHQSSVRVGYSHVVVYYMEEDTLDAEGEAVVQQEFRLLPGLLWVKPLLTLANSDKVTIKVINRHHAQCDYVVYDFAVKNPISEAKRDIVWVF